MYIVYLHTYVSRAACRGRGANQPTTSSLSFAFLFLFLSFFRFVGELLGRTLFRSWVMCVRNPEYAFGGCFFFFSFLFPGAQKW